MPGGFLTPMLNRRTAGSAGAVARASGALGKLAWRTTGPVGPWDLHRSIHDGLEKVIWVFRCVHTIASKQAGLPIILRQGDLETGQIVDDPRLWKLLNIRANSYETAWQFRYRVSVQALLSRKGAFIEVVRGNDGRPSALHLLDAEQVSPIPDPITFVSGYEVTRSDFVTQILAPDQVIWLKFMPHPTDPYQQLTPMVAMGLVAESDFLARIFNRNFILNDGRPGLLVGIKGDTNPEDALEIKRRFTGGPSTAGQTTVIEADSISVQDLGASPRDIMWLESLKAGKDEILLAFGVAESVLGNASGRTFDNADAELEGFWQHTEIDHCNTFSSGLDALTGDLDDDIRLAFDYRGVEVLQRAINTRRQNKLNEFSQGACTLDDFFAVAGEEPWNVAGTRSLFLPSGSVITRSPEDADAIRNLPNVAAAALAGLYRAEATGQGALADSGISGPQKPVQGLPGGKPQAAIGGTAANHALSPVQNVLAAIANHAHQIASKAVLTTMENKQVSDEDPDIIDAEIVDETKTRPEPYSELRATVEGLVDGGLTVWGSRQAKVYLERLDHAKLRKHTRHWEGGEVGTKAIDPDYVVNSSAWAEDISTDMAALLQPVIQREAKRAARTMQNMGVIQAMHSTGLGNADGRNPLERVFWQPEEPVDEILQKALSIVLSSANNQSSRVAQKINELDASGASMTEIKKAVTQMVGARSNWRRGLAVNLTTACIEGIRYQVFSQANDLMTKRWWTEEDERVRPTHAAIDGKSVPATKRFTVGESQMLHPCDPAGALDEIIGCRCFLGWSANLG